MTWPFFLQLRIGLMAASMPLLLAGCSAGAQGSGSGAASGHDKVTAEAPTNSSSLGSEDRSPLAARTPPPQGRQEKSGLTQDSLPTGSEPRSSSGRLFPREARTLQSLRSLPIHQIQKGRGGRSLAFKVTVADGTVGYFKPEQTFSAAHFYGELAAYYLDRELGLLRVPPTTGRAVEWAPFRTAAAGDPRLDEIVVQADGHVRGALIWWIPTPLVPIRPPEGWTHWLRATGPLPINPYQRPIEWREDRGRGSSERAFELPPAPSSALPQELSSMILFDYLATNVDRWGGDFTNVRTLGNRGPLIYLDNGAGFTAGPTARIPLMDARLHGLQRFEAETIESIHHLEMDSLRGRMSRDPLYPFLTERHFQQLELRRQHLLEHVERLRNELGDDAVFF